ncbi:GAF domain-containing protein, partial [bacterium]
MPRTFEPEAERLIDMAGSRAVLDPLPVGVAVIDAESRRIVYRNGAAKRLVARYGLPLADPKAASAAVLLHPNGKPMEPAENPVLAAIERGEWVRDTPALVPCLDGTAFAVLLDAAPLRDESGTVLGARITLREIVDEAERTRLLDLADEDLVAAERRRRMLALLSEAVRDLDSPAEVAEVTTHLVGVHLGVNRCAYATIDLEADGLYVFDGYVSGVADLAGTHRLSDLGEAMVRLGSGRTDIVDDTALDPGTRERNADVWTPLGLRAFVTTPFLRDGRPVAFFSVSQAEPRAWTPEEVRLVEEV